MTNTELFDMPIEEIKHDPFFRVDNFKDEKWYGDLKMFLSIGICATTKRKSDEMQKGVGIYLTHTGKGRKTVPAPQCRATPNTPKRL